MVLSDPAKTLYLIDISSFIFRAFFAIRSLRNKAGEPTNAIYGVASMLAKLAEDAEPQYLAVVYDSKGKGFREEIYPEYKANRSEAPEDLVPQFARIEELIRLFEIHSFRQQGVEADDLIATLTKRWRKQNPANRVIIVSSDKDLMQLVDENTNLWDTMSNKVYGPEEVEAKFGVKPTQIRDYLALVGDSSDNIPGVASIGPKSAVDLLKQFGNLDAILQAAKKGEIPGKKGETLRTNEADALISAKLATVQDELTVEVNPDDFKYRFHVSEPCVKFLRDMDFNSLVNRWQAPERVKEHPLDQKPAAPVQVAAPAKVAAPATEQGSLFATGGFAPPPELKVVSDERGFQELLSALDRAGKFAFDIETTSHNPREAQPVGLALAYEPTFGVYLPVGHRTGETQLPAKLVLEKLRPFLENARYGKIGYDLKPDWSVLSELGLNPRGIVADTLVAGYVLDPEARHTVEAMAGRYLEHQATTLEQISGKGKSALPFDLIPVGQAAKYSAEEAVLSLRLWEKFEGLLKKESLYDVYERADLPLVEILSRMERAGVNIDVDYLASLATIFEKDLKAIEQRIAAYTPSKGAEPINLNSPKQLQQLLFEDLKLPPQGKTKTGYSTDATVLEALEPLHEVPRLLLEFREVSKLKGTYVDPLPKMKDPKTGKIHGSFHQAVAATGRLSGQDPNLQNIPIRSERGKLIRRAFVPSPGNVLLSADYSQIELRLLAAMSGDKDLVGSFQREEDVHARTAAQVFGVEKDKVTDQQRNIAKAINFGLMYGKTAFGLAQELKISRKEAQETIDKYFQRYAGVKRYLDHSVIEAKERGYTMTLMGRKRFIPDIRSANPAMRGVAERIALNAPIQGTAADLMKLAMIEIDRKLREGGYGAKLVLQVHDEFVLDCPRAEAQAVTRLVSESMENVDGFGKRLSVPLKVNCGIGENWMEL